MGRIKGSGQMRSWSLLCGEQASRRGSLPGCKWGGQVSDDSCKITQEAVEWGEVEDSGALLPCSLLSQPPCSGLDRGLSFSSPDPARHAHLHPT